MGTGRRAYQEGPAFPVGGWAVGLALVLVAIQFCLALKDYCFARKVRREGEGERERKREKWRLDGFAINYHRLVVVIGVHLAVDLPTEHHIYGDSN